MRKKSSATTKNMTSHCLFETELDDENIKIDALLFEEMEEELKEYLLKRQVEGDSTDGVFDVLENLTNILKGVLTR